MPESIQHASVIFFIKPNKSLCCEFTMCFTVIMASDPTPLLFHFLPRYCFTSVQYQLNPSFPIQFPLVCCLMPDCCLCLMQAVTQPHPVSCFAMLRWILCLLFFFYLLFVFFITLLLPRWYPHCIQSWFCSPVLQCCHAHLL